MVRALGRTFNVSNTDRTEKPTSITPLAGANQLPARLREWVSRVIFLPEQRLVITASSDRTVRVYNLDTTSEPRATFEHHTEWVRDVVQLGEDLVASVSMDNRLLTWRPSSGELLGEWKHTTFLYSVAKLDESRIVVGDYGDIIVLAHDSGTSFQVQQRLAENHSNAVNDIVVHRNLILTCSKDENVKVWNSSSFKLLAKLRHGIEVNSAAVSDKYIVTVCGDGSVYVYLNADPYPLDFKLRCDSKELHAVEILNDSIIAVAGTKGLCFICIPTKSYLSRIPFESKLFSFAVLQDGRIAVSDMRGYCAIVSPPNSVRHAVERYASTLSASSSVAVSRISAQNLPWIDHHIKGPNILERCSSFIATENCGVIALHHSEGFINLVAVGRDMTRQNRLVVHAIAQLFMRRMDVESGQRMMHRSRNLNNISVLMNSVIGSVPALGKIEPNVFRGSTSMESLLGIGKGIDRDSEPDYCVDRFLLVTDVVLNAEEWSNLPVAKKKEVENAAFNLGLSIGEFGEKLELLVEKRLNDCIPSSFKAGADDENAQAVHEIDEEDSHVIAPSSSQTAYVDCSESLTFEVPTSTQEPSTFDFSTSVQDELKWWKEKGVSKNVVEPMENEEVAACIAAYLVRYEVKLGTLFNDYKAVLTKEFGKTCTFGESFVDADEDEKKMLIDVVLSALAKVTEERSLGPAKMRMKRFCRLSGA